MISSKIDVVLSSISAFDDIGKRAKKYVFIWRIKRPAAKISNI